MLEGASKVEYEEKEFKAKCHGLEIKRHEEKKMEKTDWKMFMEQIRKCNSEYRLNNNLKRANK